MRIEKNTLSLRTPTNLVQLSLKGWWVRPVSERIDWITIQKDGTGEWDKVLTERPE